MVHINATHGKTVLELSVTVCVSTLRGRCHVEERDSCCVRLRVKILVRVPSSMVLRVCVSVCVCVRQCTCGRACLSVLQDEIWELLVFDESAGVLGERCHMFCFTTPRDEGLELNSSKFQLLMWPLFVCRMCGKCHSEKTGVSPPCCPVTKHFCVKTNSCCRGARQSVAASRSSPVKAPLEERRNVFLPVFVRTPY